jgi:acyl-CoA reductase-like NAD-dependent aldehyde dehydrogenase
MSVLASAMSQNTCLRWSSDDPRHRFAVENPATGETITTVQGGDIAEMDAAIRTADQAFHSDWRWRTSQERANFLLKGADVFEAHADELAELLCRENGKPFADARLQDVSWHCQTNFPGRLWPW